MPSPPLSWGRYISWYVCTYVCMHVCMYACMYASHAPQLRSCNYFVGPWPPLIISLPYDHPHPLVASNLPIITLVARRWPTNSNALSMWSPCSMCICVFTYVCILQVSKGSQHARTASKLWHWAAKERVEERKEKHYCNIINDAANLYSHLCRVDRVPWATYTDYTICTTQFRLNLTILVAVTMHWSIKMLMTLYHL